jgi:hypothetical protein
MHMTVDGLGPRPALRCAICDHTILVAAEATVVYPAGIERAQVLRVCLAHNGPCLEKALALMENDSGQAQSMGLTQYLRQLMRKLTPVPF